MNKKKIIIISIFIVLILALVVFVYFKNKNVIDTDEVVTEDVVTLKELPKPEISGGARGELGIDKNINEATIDEYLNREDSVYRDMRMLEDPGNYENIGGDRFLSGYIEGFEVIPLPYIIPVTGLPSEVGDTYTGTTLFYDDNGKYVANYEESMDIIERIFPKDKVIFLMCGGGGYSGMTKNFLVSMGWDENKIYNTGGYWYYKGSHSIEVKKEINGEVSYDFDNVPYHNIDFDNLTKSANYRNPVVKVTELKINTSKIELEEGTSFQLNVIVLPNEATNKEIKWTSGDNNVATITDNGLVKAVGAGSTTITVKSIDGDKTISCQVVVNKKVVNNYIKLDDISKEAKEMSLHNLSKLRNEFKEITYNSDGTPNEKYHTISSDGSPRYNELGNEEYRKFEEKVEQAVSSRVNIFNKLIDNKKSFIVLINSDECQKRVYSVFEGAKKILKQNNYPYIEVEDSLSGDGTLYDSNLDMSNISLGSVLIIKDGKIYKYINPDVDSIKNEEEIKNWLSKYIDIK